MANIVGSLAYQTKSRHRPPLRARTRGAPSPPRLHSQGYLMAPSKSDLVQTGISWLDAIRSGGIPRGNVILSEGAIGSGKTTLGTEFVYRGAKDFEEPGVIVVFESSPVKLGRDAAGPGWDLAELERRQ